jgi:hypothetical protein
MLSLGYSQLMSAAEVVPGRVARRVGRRVHASPALRWPGIAALVLLLGTGCGDAGADADADACAPRTGPTSRVEAHGCIIRHTSTPDCRVRVRAIVECESSASRPDRGIRVAADADGVMLLAVGLDEARLFRTDETAPAIELLPAALRGRVAVLSQAADGGVAIAAGENLPNQGSLVWATRGDDGWSVDTLSSSGVVRLRDFELDFAGNPRVWSTDEANGNLYLYTRDAGVWQSELVAAPGEARRDSLGIDDEVVSYEYVPADLADMQLVAIEGGQVEELGSPVSANWWEWVSFHYVPLPPPRPSADAPMPDALVLAKRDDQLVLLGSDGFEREIAEAGTFAGTCPPPTDPNACPEPCDENGSGLLGTEFTGARADDGSVLVAWVETQAHYSASYYEECDPNGCWCALEGGPPTGSNGGYSYVLHLVRVTDEVEALMEISVSELRGPSSSVENRELIRGLDLRTFGDRLALGLWARDHLELLDIDLAR